MKKLPYPRLELRWRKAKKYEQGNWACDYFLVLFPKEISDIRCDKGERAGIQDVKYLLNTTCRTSTHEPYEGDVPYRDGAHAQWDSVALNIPAFSIYKNKATPIVFHAGKDSVIERVNERLHGTVAQ